MNANPNTHLDKGDKVAVVYVNTGDHLELTPDTFAVTPYGDIIEHPAALKKRNNHAFKRMGIKGLTLKYKLHQLGFDMSRWNLNLNLDGVPYSLTLSCRHTNADFETVAHLTQQHYKTATIQENTYHTPATSPNTKPTSLTRGYIHTSPQSDHSITITHPIETSPFTEITITPTNHKTPITQAITQPEHAHFLKALNRTLLIQKAATNEPSIEIINATKTQ